MRDEKWEMRDEKKEKRILKGWFDAAGGAKPSGWLLGPETKVVRLALRPTLPQDLSWDDQPCPRIYPGVFAYRSSPSRQWASSRAKSSGVSMAGECRLVEAVRMR
jgi:hypothetical protein